MKIIIKYIIPVVVLVTTITSCKKDFLEVTPKGQLIATTTNDYSLTLNNLAFLNMTGFDGMFADMYLGDEVASVEPLFSAAGRRFQQLFSYKGDVYLDNENAVELAVPMQNIYLYNKVINEAMGSVGGTEQQKKSLVAEAKAGRAWTYFLLINFYGKPYNPVSAATDPGFPIITANDLTVTGFQRNTVKEVYDLIVSDLQTALPDLPARITHRMRVSKAAGEGLLGKVMMWMGNYTEALTHLNTAMTDMANADIQVGLYDYNTMTMTPSGPQFPVVINIIENIYAKQSSNLYAFFNSELVIPPATYGLYGPTDIRRSFYSTTSVEGVTYPGGLRRRAGPASIQLGVTVPELYLLRAECKARLNDLTGARADVEYLRTRRMPAADAGVAPATASQQLAMISFILQERIREFAMQGFRFFDMRRLSVDPLFPNQSYAHSVYAADGTVKETFTATTDRLTLRIPPKVINQNPGMQNNP